MCPTLSHFCSILFVVDISFVKRKAALAIKPHLTVKSNGNILTISKNFFRTALSNEFTVGVECELQVRPNGQKGKVSTVVFYQENEKKPLLLLAMMANSAVQSSVECFGTTMLIP